MPRVDPFGHILTTLDEVGECLRRHGRVLSAVRRRPTSIVPKDFDGVPEQTLVTADQLMALIDPPEEW